MTELRFSHKLDKIRAKMADLRRELSEAAASSVFVEQTADVTGLLTCGLVTLAHMREKAVAYEIQQDDAKSGQHLRFSSRGIGMDMCPGCFVCGTTVREPGANEYLHNIAAFVSNEFDGTTIVSWFAGRARVDFRRHEPTYVQVKVGACTAHLSNLRMLDERTRSRHGVIRQADVVDAMTAPAWPPDAQTSSGAKEDA